MTKPKVAMLAKRSANKPCLVIVVDDNVANKTANHTFTYGSRFKSARIF